MCGECANGVVKVLDEMESAGEFEGCTADEKEIEMQMLGMRIRRGMECRNG